MAELVPLTHAQVLALQAIHVAPGVSCTRPYGPLLIVALVGGAIRMVYGAWQSHEEGKRLQWMERAEASVRLRRSRRRQTRSREGRPRRKQSRPRHDPAPSRLPAHAGRASAEDYGREQRHGSRARARRRGAENSSGGEAQEEEEEQEACGAGTSPRDRLWYHLFRCRVLRRRRRGEGRCGSKPRAPACRRSPPASGRCRREQGVRLLQRAGARRPGSAATRSGSFSRRRRSSAKVTSTCSSTVRGQPSRWSLSC